MSVDYVLQRSDIVIDDFMMELSQRQLLSAIRSSLEVMRPALPVKTGRLQASLNATIVDGRIMVYIPARVYYAQYVNEKPATKGFFDEAYEQLFKPNFLAEMARLKVAKANFDIKLAAIQTAALLTAAKKLIKRKGDN